MDSITQEFLECTIDLIDRDEWDRFFEYLQRIRRTSIAQQRQFPH